MSRAFIKEDPDEPALNINFLIPNHPITKRQQRGRSSKEQIREILEVPELATSYRWGDPTLAPCVF